MRNKSISIEQAGDISFSMRTRPRVRTLSIAIRRDGSIAVTRPSFISKKAVLAFVVKHGSWIKTKLTELEKRPPSLLGKHSEKEYRRHKEAARTLVYELLEHYAPRYAVTYRRVRIGNQRSRWGSCSLQRTLSFNYKILFLPRELQEYLIVHELCHLIEMNHSKKFWLLVGKTIPDWKLRRAALKKS